MLLTTAGQGLPRTHDQPRVKGRVTDAERERGVEGEVEKKRERFARTNSSKPGRLSVMTKAKGSARGGVSGGAAGGVGAAGGGGGGGGGTMLKHSQVDASTVQCV
jgi:hypothetical protein